VGEEGKNSQKSANMRTARTMDPVIVQAPAGVCVVSLLSFYQQPGCCNMLKLQFFTPLYFD
jgi:hypothetical protein